MKRNLPPKFLTAMVAVLPLPGSPLYDGNDQRVMDQALADLEVYKSAGVDSIMFENDHDLPYIQPPLDEKGIALMTRIVKAARERFEGPIGIQMLEAANITSLEIAAEADLDFIRAEAYVFAHVGGSGVINGSAGKILRRTKRAGRGTDQGVCRRQEKARLAFPDDRPGHPGRDHAGGVLPGGRRDRDRSIYRASIRTE